MVIIVRSLSGGRRLQELKGWLRLLAPTALLLVAPASLAELGDAELIELDCDEGFDGPLSVAAALAASTPTRAVQRA